LQFTLAPPLVAHVGNVPYGLAGAAFSYNLSGWRPGLTAPETLVEEVQMGRLHLQVIAFLATVPIGAAAGHAQGTTQSTTRRGVTRLDTGSLRLLHGRAASYPEGARTASIEGAVVVEAALDAKGHVMDAHVVSGPNELRAAALQSILDDHFAGDGKASRQVRVSVIFTLQTIASVPRGTAPSAPDQGTPPTIVAVDCPVLPADLCRDVRQRLSSTIGSPLTSEKRGEILQSITDLDDDLRMATPKASNGVQLLIWLPSSSDIPPGIVGGLAAGFQLDAPASPPPPPPPPTPPPAAIRVSGNVKPPRQLQKVNPVYPEIARSAKVQGVVIVEATIGTDGRVTNARVMRSIPLLDQAALDAVRQWVYEPTIVNGAAVPVIMAVTVSFSVQ
jgi:protein TonB